MNVGEALLNALKEAGAMALFGIPGDYVLPFFSVIEESNILPLFTFSHEPAVGYAADAAARYGGGIGVAVVTYGAGALSLVNAAACAWAEKSPLVIISGAPGTTEFDQGLLLHHQVRHAGSQRRIFEELTCAQAILNDPEKAPQEIARVLWACRRNSRPVYIELPRDISLKPCHPVQTSPQQGYRDAADILCAEIITQLLAKAKRPAILAGVEVRRFGLEDSVSSLSAKSGVPLVTTLMGKGMFMGPTSSCMGTYLGAAGETFLRDTIEDSDCLLMLGIIASDTNLGMAGNKIDLANAIQINQDHVIMGEKRIDGIRLCNVIRNLQTLLPAKSKNYFLVNDITETSVEKDKPLRADDISYIVNAQLKNDWRVPLAVDVGDCLFISMNIPDVPFLASGYYATMGFGVPAGMGVQAATGDRPLIIVGDGGFQMTGWELLNCARSGIDPVVLVLNNGGWGMLKQFQPQAGYTARDHISYAALAETLGGDGYKATTTGELAEALHKAFHKRGRFQLVEAVLPREDISTTLKSYIAALKSGLALGTGS